MSQAIKPVVVFMQGELPSSLGDADVAFQESYNTNKLFT